MTLLQLAQQFCLRTGLASPANVAGSTDRMINQIQALFNELLTDLLRWEWQENVVEAVFTTVATTSQGNINTIAPRGYSSMVIDSMFNRTQRLRVEGPLTWEEWEAIQATTFSAPRYYWMLQGNELLFTPTPTDGQTVAFMYKSKAFVYNAGDDEYKETFTKDSDEFILDSSLALAGMRWLWKKEKGLAYAEELRTYEELASMLAGRSKGGRTIQMCGMKEIVPGIIVPSGNWMQP